jgi:hypothetical protein
VKPTWLYRTIATLLALGTLGASAANYTYHGNLQESGRPANGSYDLLLTLYSAASGGSRLANPVTLYNIPVRDGSFSTNVDFGTAASIGQAYLDVQVKPSKSAAAFAQLDNRSAVSPSGTCPATWDLAGNAGVPGGSYLGTADGTDLTIATSGAAALRLSAPHSGTAGGYGVNVNAGWHENSIDSGAASATIAGGGGLVGSTSEPNSIAAGGTFASIGGGVDNQAAGFVSTIAGGAHGRAIGSYSTVLGGTGNYAGGSTSVAGGRGAHVRDATEAGHVDGDGGTFVWSDSTPGFTSTASNQFLVRAHGGVGINTAVAEDGGPLRDEMTIAAVPNLPTGSSNVDLTFENSTVAASHSGFTWSATPDAHMFLYEHRFDGTTLNYHPIVDFFDNGSTGALIAFNGHTYNGVLTVGDNGDGLGSGAYLTSGGVWTNASSRAFKDGFAKVDVVGVLDKLVALPVQTWFYKKSRAEGQHMGPVAEEFASVFGLGNDSQHITTVDESGVAFAAIQGLNQKLESENADLKRDNTDLRSQLADLAVRVRKLERP